MGAKKSDTATTSLGSPPHFEISFPNSGSSESLKADESGNMSTYIIEKSYISSINCSFNRQLDLVLASAVS